MNVLFVLFAALFTILMPDSAWAGVINPSSGNAWDMYVFGNGRIIFDILNSVKLLMTPALGSSGFQTLLLLMATLGFLVLAIAAGFDPGKNLVRMFTYIIVVWTVGYGSTGLVANININDMVVNKDGLKETYTVDAVPALVALPAALTSQVGWYFSKVIETYFTMPGEFKIAEGAAGQFNLFNKMVQESNEYVLTDSNIKASLSAYVTDCVVPALAMNRIQAEVLDPETGTATPIRGVQALANTPNLVETLGSAAHLSIMTKYYPTKSTDAAWFSNVTGENVANSGGFGTVMACADAYTGVKADIEANANALLKAGTTAWSNAGILTPFETAMSTALAQAAAPGGSTGMGPTGVQYSRPSGFIMQQAMLNSMNGSFRQAAIQTGNNELMQAAALSQAEAAQRSTWVAGFTVFNNMMGYVFTVLQAFIFAITPIVVIALMVPGLGKSIFTNYAQVLIWLTLWVPMLALINYIITLFGTESFQTTLVEGGGLSMSNKALLTEKTNNLVVAAQFLGTMTPLITWGLVKGSMAFTEFISSGVGSAFASQAGATAATGNLSMNNMSMDNASMNKFNTAMSSTVGTQAVNSFTNAGAALMSQDGGGGNMTMSGSQVSAQKQMSDALSRSISEGHAASQMLSDAMSKSSSIEDAMQYVRSKGHSTGADRALQFLMSAQRNASLGEGTGTQEKLTDSAQINKGGTAQDQHSRQQNVHGGLEAPGFSPVKAGATVQSSDGKSNATVLATQGGTATDRSTSVDKDKAALGTTVANGTSYVSGTRSSNTNDESNSGSHRMSASEQRVMQQAMNMSDSWTANLSATKSVVDSFGVAQDMDFGKFNNMMNQMTDAAASMPTAEAMNAKFDSMVGQVTGGAAEAEAAFAAARANAIQQRQAMGPVGGGPSPGALAQEIADVHNQAQGLITGAHNTVPAAGQKLRTDADALRNSMQGGDGFDFGGLNKPLVDSSGKSHDSPVGTVKNLVTGNLGGSPRKDG